MSERLTSWEPSSTVTAESAPIFRKPLLVSVAPFFTVTAVVSRRTRLDFSGSVRSEVTSTAALPRSVTFTA